MADYTIMDYATALFHMPKEWGALPFHEVKVAAYRGTLVACHPTYTPIIFSGGSWSPIQWEKENG